MGAQGLLRLEPGCLRKSTSICFLCLMTGTFLVIALVISAVSVCANRDQSHDVIRDDVMDSETLQCAAANPDTWMLDLTDKNKKFEKNKKKEEGTLDGSKNLFYAYGSPFKGQVAVWTYDEGNDAIDFYWAKPSCPGKTSNGCGDGKGNIPGMVAKYKLIPPYANNKIASKMPPPAEMEVKEVDGKWYAFVDKTNLGGQQDCYLENVYVCTASFFNVPETWVTVGYTQPDRQGQQCIFQGTR